MLTKVLGIETDSRIKVTEKFNEVRNDDEEIFYESKELFHHDCHDDLKFDYRYVIEGVYCEGAWFYCLMMVVMPESLNKELAEEVAESCGIDVEDLTLEDLCSYGGCTVTFGSEKTEGEDPDMEIFDKIATVFETMDRLRGFYLDKHWNAIGTTGWDSLDHAVNGKELFKF